MFRNKRLVNLISELFGNPRSFDHGNVEIEWCCPFCDNHRHKYNLAVNTDNLFFHCWSCGYKGKLSKLFWDFGNERQKQEFKNVDTYVPLTKEEKKQELVLTGIRTMRQEWKDSVTYRAAKSYLRDRKIGKDLINKWDIC